MKHPHYIFVFMTKHTWLLNPSTCPGFEKFEAQGHKKIANTIHHTEYMHVKIPQRYALVNITDLVEQVLERSQVEDGFCYIGAMHITAGIYINDAESGLLNDISQWLENLTPFGLDYQHHRTGEDNADAHLKSFLTNHQITVPVTKGKFDFGTWQQIFYGEFDGLRKKRILVKICGLGLE